MMLCGDFQQGMEQFGAVVLKLLRGRESSMELGTGNGFGWLVVSAMVVRVFSMWAGKFVSRLRRCSNWGSCEWSWESTMRSASLWDESCLRNDLPCVWGYFYMTVFSVACGKWRLNCGEFLMIWLEALLTRFWLITDRNGMERVY